MSSVRPVRCLCSWPVYLRACRRRVGPRPSGPVARMCTCGVALSACGLALGRSPRVQPNISLLKAYGTEAHASIEVEPRQLANKRARNRTTHRSTPRGAVSRRGAQSPTAKRNDELSAPRETQWSQVLRKGSANGKRARHSALRSAPIEATPNALHGVQRPAHPVPSLGSRLEVDAMAPHVSLPSVRATVAFTIAPRSDVKWQSIVRAALVEELAVVSALGAG